MLGCLFLSVYVRLLKKSINQFIMGIFEKTGTDTRTRTRTDGHKRRTGMTGSYGKDRHLWKRRAVMEKTGIYGKDGQLWKRREVMEKTYTYGKDVNKAFKSEIFNGETHTAHNKYSTYNTSYRTYVLRHL